MNDQALKVALSIVAGEPAHVTKKVGASITEYSIRGPFSRVLDEIESIFTQYPADGYGTTVTRIAIRFPGPDYEASLWRANSCD